MLISPESSWKECAIERQAIHSLENTNLSQIKKNCYKESEWQVLFPDAEKPGFVALFKSTLRSIAYTFVQLRYTFTSSYNDKLKERIEKIKEESLPAALDLSPAIDPLPKVDSPHPLEPLPPKSPPVAESPPKKQVVHRTYETRFSKREKAKKELQEKYENLKKLKNEIGTDTDRLSSYMDLYEEYINERRAYILKKPSGKIAVLVAENTAIKKRLPALEKMLGELFAKWKEGATQDKDTSSIEEAYNKLESVIHEQKANLQKNLVELNEQIEIKANDLQLPGLPDPL